ncbi:MAG: hypothetical protein SF029_08445 [bacterium]|nr:hypothetical protein [bacterium]
MGISVSWYDQSHQALLFTYQRPWKWHEFDQAVAAMLAALDDSPRTVDLIFDISAAGLPPSGDLSRFKRVSEINHPRSGKVIFVGGQSLVMNLVDLLIKLYGRAFRPPDFIFVLSLEEASLRLQPS